ncbi:protein rolling stone-like isoform X2 [Pectinophora gossypiella]|uniref:protein rolling stone-like isoform X2 n=1 Tax=Pectinophora gossypiella TaxID=13191 RepID=UPI00214E90A1|nr:protein rolling stone-like isoform X2 [Pectinophora gossypiella]
MVLIANMKKKAVAQNAVYCITAALGKIEETSDQFTRSWFGNVSPLFWRIPILIWATVVTAVSVASFWGPTEKFLLYMTHWGLMFIIVESIFGILVVIKKPSGSSDATFGLPWYVKTYWVLYNITIPVAFLVTIFYWGVLRSSVKKLNYAPNPVLDIMLHGVNSAVMLVELLCSAHPSRLLHIMQPLYFAGVYVLFTIIYFFAGGLDPWGNPFVYPVMDWSKPEQTLIVVTLTALFLGLIHLIVVGIASLRDLIAKRCLRDTTGVYNDGFDA